MALRLRRDVQKASYYVWFLGAEEAKGLRGSRVINSVLPYLIDRSRGQEPLKVTLQVSHKGIKILQGSSKHFIPHSAITSSVQTDDIVACVLLLYNPATKCPLHVHAYRCDSESTAEALHQQLQILINRTENQKRFEELETRLGIMPPMPASTSSNKLSSATTTTTSASHMKAADHSQKQYQSQQQHLQQQLPPRRLESSPKRFSSSLGSDTGNSTRESECSEEHNGSPVSRSPPMTKPLALPQQNNELFDSLAAELRAKLNGNGPPILLPPRDYDTVHRSKGNLTAIELRRCRNSLIVGSTTPTGSATQPANGVGAAVKQQVSSRGSSGIGSDLAPSPERQELNSSSDDEHWTNEADSSVIALKPSQIPLERSSAAPITAHHPQLNRKHAAQPPEDSYLRDLPSKPYKPHATNASNGNGSNKIARDKIAVASQGFERDHRSKTPSSSSWTREDEIKPIIMRPADYDVKFNRMIQAEQKQKYSGGGAGNKLHETDKYNEINRLLSKQLSVEPERETPDRQRYAHEYEDEMDAPHLPLRAKTLAAYRQENLTDKQKFIEYSTKKHQPQISPPPSKSYAAEDPPRYGGRHRYVDPADLPFEQPTHKKYAAVHHGTSSPERSDLGGGGSHRTSERQRLHHRDELDVDAHKRRESRDREKERSQYAHSSERERERNPYREPESIPYIQSMEKMMKSSALRYKAFDAHAEPSTATEAHTKLSQRSSSHSNSNNNIKSYVQHEDERDYNYNARGRGDYAPSTSSSVTPKDRFKDAKDKFRAMERTGSRYDLTSDEKDVVTDYKPHRRGSIELAESARVYDDWSDEERVEDSPPPTMPAKPTALRARSRSRDQWEQTRDMLPPRDHIHKTHERDTRDLRDYAQEMRPRELPGMRPEHREMRDARDVRDTRDQRDLRNARDMRDNRDHYRGDQQRYEARDRDMPPRTHEREHKSREQPQREHRQRSAADRTRDQSNDYAREHTRRDYTPDRRTDYIDRPMEKQRATHAPDMYAQPPSTGGAPNASAKVLSNLPKGYRHSYAEPVFARTGGRVGLAAVNPF